MTRTGGKEPSCLLQEIFKANRDLCDTVHFAPTELLHTKPSLNAITPPHTGSTSKFYTSNSKPTHSYSYVTSIKPPPQKLLSTQPTLLQ